MYVGDSMVDEYAYMQCATGYTGNLCGVCISAGEGGNQSKWGLKEAFLCEECYESKTTLYLAAILSVLGVTLVLLMTTLANLSNNRRGISGTYRTADIAKVIMRLGYHCLTQLSFLLTICRVSNYYVFHNCN